MVERLSYVQDFNWFVRPPHVRKTTLYVTKDLAKLFNIELINQLDPEKSHLITKLEVIPLFVTISVDGVGLSAWACGILWDLQQRKIFRNGKFKSDVFALLCFPGTDKRAMPHFQHAMRIWATSVKNRLFKLCLLFVVMF